jgi:hypothetical protein
MTSRLEISGIQVGALKSLKPVLNEWRDLTALENWFFEQDATWWNKERATLSVFAGAIWRSGGLALEEFATEKTLKFEPKAGRCDICFRFKRSIFLGEAKQDWPLLVSADMQKNINQTNSIVRKACSEALHTKDATATHLGIVFVTPRIHETKKKFLEDYLFNYIMKLSNRNQAVVQNT